jgi:Tfp pilus assembly protein PilO
MERRASAPERDEDSRLARLQVSMVLSGAYRDIRRFIHALETAPEFVIIEEIVLSQGNETEIGEVLSLGLSTYYWHGDDEP